MEGRGVMERWCGVSAALLTSSTVPGKERRGKGPGRSRGLSGVRWGGMLLDGEVGWAPEFRRRTKSQWDTWRAVVSEHCGSRSRPQPLGDFLTCPGQSDRQEAD